MGHAINKKKHTSVIYQLTLLLLLLLLLLARDTEDTLRKAVEMYVKWGYKLISGKIIFNLGREGRNFYWNWRN